MSEICPITGESIHSTKTSAYNPKLIEKLKELGYWDQPQKLIPFSATPMQTATLEIADILDLITDSETTPQSN